MKIFTPKKPKALVIGASGMAGQAFTKELLLAGFHPQGLSRKGPDIFMDAVQEEKEFRKYISLIKPTLIINCAAIVSLQDCEKKPKIAYAINSELPGIIAECASKLKAKFIHISTDHYYSGDKDLAHKEDHPIKILNYYAETKRAGEINAEKNKESLIIRTNITGMRGNLSRPTFAEWLINCIKNEKPLELYTDFYTSTLDTGNFARLTLNKKIIESNGILNVASSTISNKKSFAVSLAKELGCELNWYKDATVKDLNVPRAESLGLDCSKAEKLLGSKMPDLLEVVKSLAVQHRPV